MSHQDINQITIASYDKYIDEYTRKDSQDMDRREAYWPGVEHFMSVLKPNTEIFEIGSAMGRHASAMEKAGFKVQRSDASRSFVKYLNKHGYTAKQYDVLSTEIVGKYQAIYAHAVLLHFPLLEFRRALRTIYKSLEPSGIFCFSMKLGDFEGWREKGLSGRRYFRYWSVEDLCKELQSAEFSILNTFVTADDSFVFLTVQKSL